MQFFPTAEESMEYYNQKRCIDGKGLVLPSQIVSIFLAINYLWDMKKPEYLILTFDVFSSFDAFRGTSNILKASWLTSMVKISQVAGN